MSQPPNQDGEFDWLTKVSRNWTSRGTGLDRTAPVAGKFRTARLADVSACGFRTLVGACAAGLREAVGILGIVSDDLTNVAKEVKDPHHTKEKEKKLGRHQSRRVIEDLNPMAV